MAACRPRRFGGYEWRVDAREFQEGSDRRRDSAPFEYVHNTHRTVRLERDSIGASRLRHWLYPTSPWLFGCKSVFLCCGSLSLGVRMMAMVGIATPRARRPKHNRCIARLCEDEMRSVQVLRDAIKFRRQACLAFGCFRRQLCHDITTKPTHMLIPGSGVGSCEQILVVTS